MFKLESTKDVKSLVSGLRRELKKKDVQFGHNQLLEIVAKAMGLSGAEELSARLPGAASAVLPTVSPKYPLQNTGQFDFSKQGTLCEGLGFNEVLGTLEDIRNCVAYATEGTRNLLGGLIVDYEGTTEVNWGGQVAAKNASGVALYSVEGSTDPVPGTRLVLVPELPKGRSLWNIVNDPEDKLLPVRPALVAEYLTWFQTVEKLPCALTDGTGVSVACDTAAKKLGFALTEREVRTFIEKSLAAPVAKPGR